MDLVSVPTAGPMTPNGNPVDECDDDQANCHSGTGDDFQLTGAEPTLIPSLCLVRLCPLCVYLSLIVVGGRVLAGPLEKGALPRHVWLHFLTLLM